VRPEQFEDPVQFDLEQTKPSRPTKLLKENKRGFFPRVFRPLRFANQCSSTGPISQQLTGQKICS